MPPFKDLTKMYPLLLAEPTFGITVRIPVIGVFEFDEVGSKLD
jgi:hypothetical protein